MAMLNEVLESLEQIESMLARHPAGMAIVQTASESPFSSGPLQLLLSYAAVLSEFVGGKPMPSAAPRTAARTHASIRESLRNHPSADLIFSPLSDEESGTLSELAAWSLRMAEVITGLKAGNSVASAAPTASPINSINSTSANIEELRACAAVEKDLSKKAVLCRQIRVLRDGADYFAPQPDEPSRRKIRRND